MNSPQKFNFTTSGRILRKKTPLKTAYIHDIVHYMFEPKSHVPPAGYKFIITKLINDPYIAQLIQRGTIKIPQVHNENTPRRPVVKNPVINKYKNDLFEPEEWT
jgi:hypothetical protein